MISLPLLMDIKTVGRGRSQRLWTFLTRNRSNTAPQFVSRMTAARHLVRGFRSGKRLIERELGAQFIAQGIETVRLPNLGLAAPALANDFPGKLCLMGAHRFGEFRAQIKITSHALVVRTVKTKTGFG